MLVKNESYFTFTRQVLYRNIYVLQLTVVRSGADNFIDIECIFEK